jgi:hypothetical protein
MELLIETLPSNRRAAHLAEPLAAQLSIWAARRAGHADAATALSAVLTWSRLHGFVSLEIAGNYASMSIDPDGLFEAELHALPA